MKTVEDIESLIKQCREIETLINHLLKALEVEVDNVVKKTSVISPLVGAFLDEMAEICVAYDLVVSQERFDAVIEDN